MTPGNYRPTILKMASKHCPRAVDYYEAGQPGDRRIYDTGTAAHACLQAFREAANKKKRALEPDEAQVVSLKVCQALIETGRTFDGDPEPPLPADSVWLGQELALEYHAHCPMEPGPMAEVGLAVNERWELVPYSKKARLRLILDVLDSDDWEDEESFYRYVLVEDYKSAWSTDASELDTLQLKAQAVVAAIRYPDAEVIIQRVVNLRTRKSYERKISIQSEDGQAMLASWRRQLETTMEALDGMRSRNGERPPRPGGGCNGCPYFGACPHGQDYIERAEALQTPAELARGYMAAAAALGHCRDRLKDLTDGEPVEVDGFQVGYFPQEVRALTDEAYGEIADNWIAWGAPDLRGFAKALSLGAPNLDSFCRVRFANSGEGEEDDFRRLVTTKKVQRPFKYERR